MKIEIEEFDQINYSPGFALAAKGWAELAATEYGAAEVTMHWSHKTIVARVDGNVSGVIVWEKLDHCRQAWIVLGYVDPAHRQRGVYNALYQRMVEIARREGLRSVAGGIAFTNRTMRTVAERQGRVPVAVTYREVL